MSSYKLKTSISPHIRSKQSVSKIMWTVNLSLMPVFLFSIYNFGIQALFVTLTCVISCVLIEALCLRLRGKPIDTVFDGSAVLTGILLAFNLPPDVPLWIPAVGSIVAIGVAKQAFGGLGYNIFNPALAARCFLLSAWPVEMTTWQVHGITGATPLGIFKEKGMSYLLTQFSSQSDMYSKLFSGNIGGCIGETSVILLILGSLLLFYKKIIRWHTPVAYISFVFILGWLFGGQKGFLSGDPLFYIFSGGLFLGALYMATDMVTTPLTNKGKFIFGLGCGLLTFLIRKFGSYPEGVSYSILLMNTATPIIDRYIKNRKFGNPKGKK
ncbi:RnfABCDGE type electron transport complex subunit D [bacterium]|nr:RnfABCDGE type electron transport complex subunit D [bacterium]